MGTRSTIALEFADGTVEAVYCHWDGYLEHNGKILQEHYSDPFKLRNLIDLGGLSILAANIGTKHDFNERVEGECKFYARDRGEDLNKDLFLDFEDYTDNADFQEYNYILRCINGKAVWFVSCDDKGFVELTEAFKEMA